MAATPDRRAGRSGGRPAPLPVVPAAIELSVDIEHRPDRPQPFRARVRWTEPGTGRRPSRSAAFAGHEAAQSWVERLRRHARSGIHPAVATMTLAAYGESVIDLALRGLEPKTLDPYLSGWRLRVVPALGHVPTVDVRTGDVDRAVHGWIADGCSLSTIKNSLAHSYGSSTKPSATASSPPTPPGSPAGNTSSTKPKTNSTTHEHSPFPTSTVRCFYDCQVVIWHGRVAVRSRKSSRLM
jgi:hypothetical protein